MTSDTNNLNDLFFAAPEIRYPGDLPATLVETGAVSLPDDVDTGLNEWLLGQSFFPEVFATETARDARLGFAHPHVTFVPTTWAQALAGGTSLADVAIGPALGKAGFEELAEIVLPAKLDRLVESGFGGGGSEVSVIIDRVDYVVHRDADGALTVTAQPLYHAWLAGSDIDATMVWLHQTVAARLFRVLNLPAPATVQTSYFRRSV